MHALNGVERPPPPLVPTKVPGGLVAPVRRPTAARQLSPSLLPRHCARCPSRRVTCTMRCVTIVHIPLASDIGYVPVTVEIDSPTRHLGQPTERPFRTPRQPPSVARHRCAGSCVRRRPPRHKPAPRFLGRSGTEHTPRRAIPANVSRNRGVQRSRRSFKNQTLCEAGAAFLLSNPAYV